LRAALIILSHRHRPTTSARTPALGSFFGNEGSPAQWRLATDRGVARLLKQNLMGISGLRTHIGNVPICGTFQNLKCGSSFAPGWSRFPWITRHCATGCPAVKPGELHLYRVGECALLNQNHPAVCLTVTQERANFEFCAGAATSRGTFVRLAGSESVPDLRPAQVASSKNGPSANPHAGVVCLAVLVRYSALRRRCQSG